ncbi:MAG: hypothetical protein KAS32_06265, partial [Candidatus Peribacteraceae bacterium]|nr:hypothetical protein [Candidatus Peribacteraceae bacterium]
ESYEQHLKICPTKGKPPEAEQKVITFELSVWQRFLAGLKHCLTRQIGDTRKCPDCGHEFVPEDETHTEAVNAYVGIFGDPNAKQPEQPQPEGTDSGKDQKKS